MKNLRLKLAQWIAPKGVTIGFLSQTFDAGKPGPVKILQNQFSGGFDGLADVVDDGTDMVEYGGMTPGNPSDLWRETRKQLVEEKTDGNQD